MSSIIKVDTIKDTSDNTLLTSSSGNVSISNDLTVDTDTLYVDSTNNRVGIGTSSPIEKLEVYGTEASGGVELLLTNVGDGGTTTTPYTAIRSRLNSIRNGGEIRFGRDNNYGSLADADSNIQFYTAIDDVNTERMRIDSSGNLLVGKTATGYNTAAGTELWSNGFSAFTRDSATVSYFNRKTSDGSIVQFLKDGTAVGSIGVASSVPYFDNPTGSGLEFGGGRIYPRSSGAASDNTIDFGDPSFRWDDIYATNGTIQTSDQNEKQQIASLTDAEMNVAKRLSALFKTYKWNSAVEKKGDNARTHTGVIAQEVQQAFADEGLDAGNYGMFMSNTCWEKEISVDAVEAQDAVYETQTDEEGNEIQVLVQEAVEGKDAYTYMDTKEEATEGYTQRTRLGIRYPELLSFVSSAFEQRLTDIETRLTALEA